MSDLLRKYLSAVDIKLVYTDNKFTVLSSGYKNNEPCIRAHNCFKGCKEEVAKAIVGYYSEQNPKEKYLGIIKKYVEDKFPGDKYIIKPAGEKFKTLIFKNDEPIYKQLTIKKIYKKDENGNTVDIKADQTINGENDKIVELNIIVDYSFDE